MAGPRTTSVKLEPEVKDRLEKLARLRRRSPHWLMREAIAEYVAREEAREQFKKDALVAWAEYQATGLHVTQAEADAWLKKRAAGEDIPPPTAHE